MSRPASAALRAQSKVIEGQHGRILCIADIRGRLSGLNELARETNAMAIIHTGDFGFFDAQSLDRINDRTLRHLTMYSPLIPSAQRTHLLSAENTPAQVRQTVNISLLSEFPLLHSGQVKLNVPVYTTWGACEDVLVLEKFRSGQYQIDNLHVIDEATTHLLDIGGVKLRLLGIGGALVPHKLFDNGDGNATIAGGQGTMWLTALQLGELVDTAQKVHDPSETRVLVSHASPGREGIMAQLALVLKADLTISAGLHFRYATSYNEFSVQNDIIGFRNKLLAGKEQFERVWESVKSQVDAVIDENQRLLLEKALSVVERLPALPGQQEDPSWKNCWNWNLCDAAYGNLVLDVKEGRISAELKSQGFNYAYRRTPTVNHTPNSVTSALPMSTNPPTKGPTPAPPAPKSTTATSPPPAQPSGTATTSSKPGTPAPAPDKSEKDKEKAERDKAKKKEKRDKKKEAAAAEKEKEKEKDGNVEPLTDGAVAEEIKSPVTETSAPSTGARTPKGTKPARNPWTIFMRMPGISTAPTEAEVREFYGESAAGITKVTIPPRTQFPNQPKLAYVEFGDEEAMKAGLEKHAEKIKDIVPDVMQATDASQRQGDSFNRGRGRGRGGGGGGFAARGFAMAGLTGGRRNSERGNGDASTASGGEAPSKTAE